jgi:hypothetical protein
MHRWNDSDEQHAKGPSLSGDGSEGTLKPAREVL